jgi:hypothetical protein
MLMHDDRLPLRFWAKVTPTPSKRFPGNPCWQWIGACLPQGYGRVWDGQRVEYPHRWTYAALVGPIPEGLEIDHLCRVRGCCNPTHLEPKTHRDNHLARGSRSFAKLHLEHRRCTGFPRCIACRGFAA